MENTFLLNVTACDRVFFEGRCRQVVIPLEDGERRFRHITKIWSLQWK